MDIYDVSIEKTAGTSFRELDRNARKAYQRIQRRTPRRQPYVRSKYFKKDKVFLRVFWEHLKQKRSGDQSRRLIFYEPALELIRNTTRSPDSLFEAQSPDVFLHRFYGRTRDGAKFCVQIKDNRRSGRKDLMSVFPIH
jgi:hypothetical protein